MLVGVAMFIPLTIVNETQRGPLYMYLVGTTDPKDPEHHWYHLRDFSGALERCVPGEATYSLPLPSAETTIQLPRLSGMRIYFSFAAELPITVGADGIPGTPVGWAPGASFHTLFDWIELTWEVNAHDTTLGGNTTQVDMFGLPFALSLTGSDAGGKPTTVTGGFGEAGLRDKIFAAIKQAPAPWPNLVIAAPDGSDLRVVSPYHGMELETFPRDQLAAYIDAVWAKYADEPLLASAEGVALTGKVVDGALVFTGGDEPITFARPDGFTVYTSGPTPTGPRSSAAGVLQAALQAAFLRSTLLVSNRLPDCRSDLYYRHEPVNRYAAALHAFATRGGAYAFGFDDVCEGSSFVIVHQPRAAKITLLPF